MSHFQIRNLDQIIERVSFCEHQFPEQGLNILFHTNQIAFNFLEKFSYLILHGRHVWSLCQLGHKSNMREVIILGHTQRDALLILQALTVYLGLDVSQKLAR